jgi:hypothetical protein
MAVPPFDLYLDKWVANFKHYIEVSGMSQLLRAAGAKVAEMVASRRRQHRRRAPEFTSRDQRIQAVRRWMGIQKKDTKKVMLEAWRRRWREVTRKSKRGNLAARKEPDLTNHKVYKDLYKHQAFVLMQVRTECVGMADFLF